MATAKKLPSGNWRVLIYTGKENGKRQYKSFTAETKKEAEHMATSYQMEINHAQASPASLTVGEAIDKYIASKDAILSPSTIRVYKKYRDLYLQSIINTKLQALTMEAVQEAVNQDARKSSPKTIRNAHGLLSAALAQYHPTLSLKTKFPPKIKKEMRIPENEQVIELMQKVRGTYLELAIILGALVGLRRSEICALTRDDIDAENNTISIDKAVVLASGNDKANGTKSIEWVTKGTKTYSSTRKLTLSPDIIKRILELAPLTGLIVPQKPNTITKAFIRIRRENNYSFRFHDLRHYHASVLLALGIPDKYAMRQMGHATTHMLKSVYQHIMNDKQKEVTASINNHFGAMMQHEKQHET